jgi:hypothetical protein
MLAIRERTRPWRDRWYRSSPSRVTTIGAVVVAAELDALGHGLAQLALRALHGDVRPSR